MRRLLTTIALLAGLAVSSLAATAFALGGSILAVLTAHLFGAESDLITGGLLGTDRQRPLEESPAHRNACPKSPD